MKLLVFRSWWGMTGTDVAEMLARIAAAGYDGVEGAPPDIAPAAFRRMLDAHGLQWIANIYTATPAEFGDAVARAADGAPLKVIAHSGRDAMTRDEGCRYFEQALALEAQHGLAVGHETHRGRLLATPWDALYYLQRFPALKLNVDFSHWVVVCERLPDDQAAALALACARAIHIHGRVGDEEGPQVPHPAAPEFQRLHAWYEAQWDAIRAAHAQQGRDSITFTPEYGPPGYLHTLPFTRVPVADLWEVCVWQMQRIRAHWPDLA